MRLETLRRTVAIVSAMQARDESMPGLRGVAWTLAQVVLYDVHHGLYIVDQLRHWNGRRLLLIHLFRTGEAHCYRRGAISWLSSGR